MPDILGQRESQKPQESQQLSLPGLDMDSILQSAQLAFQAEQEQLRIQTEQSKKLLAARQEIQPQLREGLATVEESTRNQENITGRNLAVRFFGFFTGNPKHSLDAALQQEERGKKTFSNALQQFALRKESIAAETEMLSAPFQNAQRIAESALKAKKLTVDLAKSQLDATNSQLDAFKKASALEEDSRDDLFASMDAQDLIGLQQQIITSDEPVAFNGAHGVPVRLAKGHVATAIAARKTQNLELRGLQLATASKDLEFQQVQEKRLLEMFSGAQLKNLAAAGGKMLDAEGQEIQFPLEAVNERLQKVRAAQLEIAQNQFSNPVVAAVQAATTDTENQLQTVMNNVEKFGITQFNAPTSKLIKSMSVNRRTSLAFNAAIEQGQDPAEYDEGTLQAVDERTNAFITEVGQIPEAIAKQFAGGNKDVESFIGAVLQDQQINPEVTAQAFSAFALNPDNQLQQSSVATRASAQAFSESMQRLINGERKKNGDLPLTGTAQLLAALSEKPESKASFANAQRTSILQAQRAFGTALAEQIEVLPKGLLTNPRLLVDGQPHPIGQVDMVGLREAARLGALKEADAREIPKDTPQGQVQRGQLFTQHLAAQLNTRLMPPGGQFETAFQAYEDFVTQDGYIPAVKEWASGQVRTFVDEAANRQGLDVTIAEYADDVDSLLKAGATARARQLANSELTTITYKNDGLARMDAILSSIDPAKVSAEDRKLLSKAVRDKIALSNLGPSFSIVDTKKLSGNNANIEKQILSYKFQDPNLERIRKAVAKEWSTVAPTLDRLYRLQDQSTSGFFTEEGN